MSQLSEFRIFWKSCLCFPIINEVFSGEHWMGLNNPSLAITVCHHSASLVMPIDDPRNDPTLIHWGTSEIAYQINLGQNIANL